jgi:hypothetical protein
VGSHKIMTVFNILGCGLCGLGQGPAAVFCEHGNELSFSIKLGEFID